MALVIIQIQDKPDGSVSVNLANEPHIAGPKANFTEAEKLGAVALNAIHGELEAIKKPAAPKLVIVGADEMPR